MVGASFLGLLVLANWAGVRHPLVYASLGIGGVWLAFLLSGVHATIAGVLAAMTIPARPRLTGHEFLEKGKALIHRFEEVFSPDQPALASQERQRITSHIRNVVTHVQTPLQQLEHVLHPWVMVVVMPLFALANAGIHLDSGVGATLISPVALGVCAGLLLGKPAGILSAVWVTTRYGFAAFPGGVLWPQLAAVGVLAGIGFTMSLFLADLAFGQDASLIPAKTGILIGSTVAGLLGWLALKHFTNR